MGIQLLRVVLNEIFWEYNSAELPQREYFENTIPQNCFKWNVLRIQFRRIVSKRNCCENTTLQSSLKWKCGNTTLQSYFKGNVVGMEPLQSVLGRNLVGCNLLRVLQEEMLFWWHWLRVTIIILDFLLSVKFDFPLGVDFFFFFFNLDDDSGSILNFQLKVEFYSLNDDSGSRFIYVWLSMDDSRSRISNFFFFTIRGQGLIFDWWLRVRN